MLYGMDDTPSQKTEAPGKVPILIDGRRVLAPRGSTNGAELRQLTDPPVGADRDLWLDREGALDDLIEDNETVELRPQMRFFTVPKIINPGTCSC